MNKFLNKLNSGFLKFRKLIALPFQVVLACVAILALILCAFIDYAMFINNFNIFGEFTENITIEKEKHRNVKGSPFITAKITNNERSIEKVAA